MLVGDRIAFLSDHEGSGSLYSSLADGSDLRRHTPLDGFYARHAATDGTRVVYSSAGELWLLDDLDGDRRAAWTSGSAAPAPPASPTAITTGEWLGRCARPHRPVQRVAVRGTVHRLTHRDGPARALQADARRAGPAAAPLGEDRAVVGRRRRGEDAVCIAPLDPRAPDAPERSGSASSAGCWSSCPRPTAAASPSPPTTGGCCWSPIGEFRELARSGDGEVYDVAFSPDSAWLAYCDPVGSGLSQVVLVRLEDSEACRSPRAASATPSRCSPSTASTSRSSPCAASTRSTTSTPST